MYLNILPDTLLVLPMRTHFVYDVSGKKITKIAEEWYGLTHLTAQNTYPPLLVKPIFRDIILAMQG